MATAVAAADIDGLDLPLAVIIADDTVIPGPQANWRQISTPHREIKPSGTELVTYWYKSSFIYDAETVPPWILLPKLRSGGKIYVNGVEMDRLQESSPEWNMRWRHPHLVFVPTSAMNAGENQIAIRTTTREPRTTFGGIRIGSESAMRKLHDHMQALEHTSNDVLSGATLFIGVLTSGVWFNRRRERTLGLFGLSLLFWSLFAFLFRMNEVPMALHGLWFGASYFTFGGFFVIFNVSLIGYYGALRPWLARLFILLWLVSSLIYLVCGVAVRGWMDPIWMAIFLGMLGYGIVLSIKVTVRQPKFVNTAISISFLILLLALWHDYAARYGMFNLPEIYLLHLAIPGLLITAGMVALARYVNSLNRADRLKKDIALQISGQAAQDASYQRLRSTDSMHAATNERQRIMREMHDGVGSHLLSALVIAQRGSATQEELVEMLKECVDEMRLTIDTFAPTDPDLLSVLGNFRFRMESRFKAVGIRLDWRNHDMPDQLALGPDAGLQVLRILQEALTNVLKHAGAQLVEIDVRYKRDGMQIRIRDDGIGFNSVRRSTGQGLGNMQLRAQKIGGFVSIAKIDAGTEILLDIPFGVAQSVGLPVMMRTGT